MTLGRLPELQKAKFQAKNVQTVMGKQERRYLHHDELSPLHESWDLATRPVIPPVKAQTELVLRQSVTATHPGANRNM